MYKQVTECCIGNIRLSLSHFTLYSHKVDGSNLQVAGIFSRLLALNENLGGGRPYADPINCPYLPVR